MFKFNMNDKIDKKIHFIGIGGVSMSGIAKILLSNGFKISGSDSRKTDLTNMLENSGAKIFVGQKKENIDPNTDIFVYTDAISKDNEELIAAFETGKPTVSRGVFLGALMRNYLHSIAVSGSHGKSTTTSMISKILVNSSVNPSILLGGKLDDINGNVLCGGREYLLTEACEFKANILHFYPSIAIVLNIDEDHLDFYKNLDHIVDTFIGYMKNLDENSKAIINADDPNCLPLIDHIKGDIITFGMNNEKVDYKIENIVFDKIGRPTFDIKSKKLNERFKLNIIGKYNIYNATAAIIAAFETGIDIDIIKKQIGLYKNLHRRMEIIGEKNGATIMTDYAHHPVEIKAVLGALAEHKSKRVIAIFQPHTYSRTKSLLEKFSNAFYDADIAIVTEIYPSREKFDPTIHSKDLVNLLIKNGVDAKYMKTFDEIKEYIIKEAQKGDIVITVGAGDNDVLAKMIAEA